MKNYILSLQAIRRAVEESGFKAKEATVTVAGKIRKNDSGNYVLETSAGERFMLKTENQSTLGHLSEAEGTIFISDRAENCEKDETVLWIQAIDKTKS